MIIYIHETSSSVLLTKKSFAVNFNLLIVTLSLDE